MVLPRPIECTRGIGNLLAFPRTVLLHNLRVKAGLQNARAKGKRLGQPPKNLDNEAIMALRHNGLGWRAISKQLGVRSALSRRSRTFENLGRGFWNAIRSF